MAWVAVASIGIGAVGLAGASGEAESIRQQGAFQQQQLRFNKKLAEIDAKDAVERGEEQVKDLKSQAAQVQGSQKAALAAQGIDIDVGTAVGIADQTQKQVETDVARVRNNAWREAWGFKIEASNLGTQARQTGIAASNQASSTILAGGLNAAGTIVGGFAGKK